MTDDASTVDVLTERQAWVKHMRLQFCVREEFDLPCKVIHEDGTLNQAYFRPDPSVFQAVTERKWTEKERGLLVRGIEKYGIGHFREIAEEYLPDWSGNDLRLKCIRLIGRQNLQLYRDWRGDAAAIQREYERNRTIGLALNAWKGGALVYDDDGKVLAEIMATEPVSSSSTLS
ncbi:hypothetical protein SYNPS1DRAFT_14309 [Syncephalis pseudoplumigaleata]|uniref:Myb-like domain-containing protein n=1 Tax=Syncephalis pseudoplumigaleata TaxID=1712513 RepID=A0A4P9Z307_9FUNG|nr:hypothetical protein SYNPS1DRAFT_14309 [Syncephalis pseudoplumigaleata]|eukprot:RKP26352.1 hypothetical protein SYNPS1DRAFT_14309 [Syncephalis pseudoplumigaleata]